MVSAGGQAIPFSMHMASGCKRTPCSPRYRIVVLVRSDVGFRTIRTKMRKGREHHPFCHQRRVFYRTEVKVVDVCKHHRSFIAIQPFERFVVLRAIFLALVGHVFNNRIQNNRVRVLLRNVVSPRACWRVQHIDWQAQVTLVACDVRLLRTVENRVGVKHVVIPLDSMR